MAHTNAERSVCRHCGDPASQPGDLLSLYRGNDEDRFADIMAMSKNACLECFRELAFNILPKLEQVPPVLPKNAGRRALEENGPWQANAIRAMEGD